MTTPEKRSPQSARLIAMGSAALAEGFSLIGAEVVPDATPQMVEQVLEQLVKRQEKALVFLEHDLARSSGPWLTRVRDEGGRIVVTEIPSLHLPALYHPLVEDVVKSVLGPSALEDL